SEMGMVDGLDEAAEDLAALGELRVFPEVVLVVNLQDQGHAALRSEGQAALESFDGELPAGVERELGAALATEDAAVVAAQSRGHVDPALLPGDLPGAEGGVRMGEVGRTAEHGDTAPAVLDLASKAGPVGFVGHFQEACIPFQAF